MTDSEKIDEDEDLRLGSKENGTDSKNVKPPRRSYTREEILVLPRKSHNTPKTYTGERHSDRLLKPFSEWNHAVFMEVGIEIAVERFLGISFRENLNRALKTDMFKELTIEQQKRLFDEFSHTTPGPADAGARNEMARSDNDVDNGQSLNAPSVAQRGEQRNLQPEIAFNDQVRLNWIADAINAMKVREKKIVLEKKSDERPSAPRWLTDDSEIHPPTDLRTPVERDDPGMRVLGEWIFVNGQIYLVGHILGFCRNNNDADEFFKLLVMMGRPDPFLCLVDVLKRYVHIFQMNSEINEMFQDRLELEVTDKALKRERLKWKRTRAIFMTHKCNILETQVSAKQLEERMQVEYPLIDDSASDVE